MHVYATSTDLFGSEAKVDADEEGDGCIQAECHACERSSLLVSLAAAGLHTHKPTTSMLALCMIAVGSSLSD